MSADKMAAGVRLLFATPVIVAEIEQAKEIGAALQSLILAKRREHPGLALSNRGGWQSTHDFAGWSGEHGRTIIERALELANAHTATASRAPPRWTVEAWANVSESGAFNMPHVHGGTFWSAVYYVSVGKGEGGQLVLHDPRMPALRMHAPGVRFAGAGPELKAEISPKAGLMVLFPGWLSHSVEPWEGSAERISIAMNIRAANARA